MRTVVLLLVGLVVSSAAHADQWKAGTARVDISPTEPIPMAGYWARRDRPFTKVVQPLYARALALQYGDDRPVVLVSLDLVGTERATYERVIREIRSRFGLPPERVLLVSTHTHTGPIVQERFKVLLGIRPEQAEALDRYQRRVEEAIVEAVGQALGSLKPARLRYGESEAGFAANRRAWRNGRVVLGVNPDGPVDRLVPVLWVLQEDDKPAAVVFGYACHCTTLTERDMEISGDFAGYAAEKLESEWPGAVALFVTGCGGDANPQPRGGLELAKRHGAELARAVRSTLQNAREVGGPVQTALLQVPLKFDDAPPLSEFERRAQGHPNVRLRLHARWVLHLARRHGGSLPTEYPYLVQGWRFGDDLVLVALAGEVVAEYSLNIKARYATKDQAVWVVAYANDVFAYIPTKKMLEEGGYEPVGSMVSYGWPTTWAPDVEKRVLEAVDRLMDRLGVRPAP